MKSYKIYEDQEHSRMIHVEGGSFLLDDKIECEVSGFWIGQYAVSQELWVKVMGNNPSHFEGKNLPVETISWYDAVDFCNALSKAQGLDVVYEIDKTKKDPNNQNERDDLRWTVEKDESANGYRLPTEAEWEFAARGGNAKLGTRYSGSQHLSKVGTYGWYTDEQLGQKETQELGLKVPNELGLYDLSGNVFDWCEDWRGDYPTGPLKDPQGPEKGHSRVLRGGSWVSSELRCRVSYRNSILPDYRNGDVGFRLSRTVW